MGQALVEHTGVSKAAGSHRSRHLAGDEQVTVTWDTCSNGGAVGVLGPQRKEQQRVWKKLRRVDGA